MLHPFTTNAFAVHCPVRRTLLCALLIMLSSIARPLRADEPPTKPLLRVETGTHNGSIKDMAVDAQETYFATCSQDGTLRIWDLATGNLQKTLRVPYAPADGMLYTVTISPDGKQIATSGLTGYAWDKSISIYIFDRASGEMTKRIAGIAEAVQILRYSPDGKYLAAGLGGKNGLVILRVSDGTVAASDKEYDADCFGMDFYSDGFLVTTGLDGLARIYSPDFKLQLRRKLAGGTHPHAAAFSPDGEKIAVGFGDTKNISVLAFKDLSLLYTPDTSDVKLAGSAFDSVAWSKDGKQLFAAGRAGVVSNNTATRIIRRYENGGQGKHTDIAAAGDIITALRPLKLGPTLYCAGDPLWGVLEGDKARLFEAPTVDMRTTTFLISDDASVIQFSALPNDQATVRFNAEQRKLESGIGTTTAEAESKGKAAGLHPTIIGVPGLDLKDWEGSMHPKVNSHPIELVPNESVRSLAILPDHKRFLLGCDFTLRLVTAEGKQEWVLPTPGIAWQINVSTDGETAVILMNDGTVRWLKIKDGMLMLSLFPLTDQKQWVAWSPGGYYDASAGSEDLIGWHINRGKDHAADFFPASRFRAQFYRPDVVGRVLKARGEAEAVRLADADRGHKTQVVDVDKTLPPIVTITSPENNAEQSAAAVKVQFALRTPADAPVTAVRALIDGRPLGTERRIQEVASGTATETVQTLDVTLPDRDCELSIIAQNKNGASAPAMIKVRWKGQAPVDITKPKLYVLAVGVSKYKNPAYTLDFAAKDAADFAAALQMQSGKLYRGVEVKLLTDDQAGKDAVLDGLEWIQKQTTSRDVAMIFLSGHGVRDSSGDYYYVPFNFDMEKKRSTGVLFYEVEKTIKDIAGKVLFFVDTCHSGGAGGKTRGIEPDIVSIVNELSSAENGAIVFAASTGKEYALEDMKWGHGAFTKALLEGLAGKADLKGDGRVTVTSLDYFLSERVKELTGGAQHPTTTKPPSVPDFPIAIVK